LVNIIGSLKVGLIKLDLVLECAISNLVHGLVHKVRYNFTDDFRTLIDADHIVGLGHNLLIMARLGLPEALDLVDFTEKSNSFEELISGTCFLWLEE